MPKAEVGSSKWLGNKMKSKGLQKLRWFCQMCQKQCRDANGFKCHMSSEAHQRQLLVVAENPNQFIGEYSAEFDQDFMQILRTRFGTKRVHANMIYQEYIKDKGHIHMNATRWQSLTGYIMYLGKTGKCQVEQTEKGWFIQYIDRDPETLKRQDMLAKKAKMEKTDEERLNEFIERQVERAKANAADNSDSDEDKVKSSELKRENEDEKIVLSLNIAKKPKLEASEPSSETHPKLNPFELPSTSKTTSSSSSKSKVGKSDESKKSKSALDELREEEERRKDRMNRKDYWLHEGIVVKIITKKMGDDYYKRKGVVEKVLEDNYTGIVRLVDNGKIKLKLDQSHLETVIPAISRQVLIVNGAYRGLKATLLSLDEKKFCVTVKIDEGVLKGRIVEKVQYEDVSKLNLEVPSDDTEVID